jgi:hypothetical protein
VQERKGKGNSPYKGLLGISRKTTGHKGMRVDRGIRKGNIRGRKWTKT